MPKYYQDKVYGYYLYFTSLCVVGVYARLCKRAEIDGDAMEESAPYGKEGSSG